MRIFSLFIILSSVFLMGCSDDDSSDPTSDDQIVGRWELTHQQSGNLITNDTPCHQQSYIQWNGDFTADRKAYTTDGQGQCLLTAEAVGTWEVISESDDESSSSPNYRFITDEGSTIEETIIFLDNNTLYIDYSFIDFYYTRVE